MAESPGAGSAGGQQETRDGPHLRPSFLLSERPPVAGGDGRDAGCQADTPPGCGQQVSAGQAPVAAAIVRADTNRRVTGRTRRRLPPAPIAAVMRADWRLAMRSMVTTESVNLSARYVLAVMI